MIIAKMNLISNERKHRNMEELFSHPASGFALLGLLLLIGAGLYLRRVKLTTRIIIHIALMLALSIILHQLRLFHLPQGGAVTLGAMLPLMLPQDQNTSG